MIESIIKKYWKDIAALCILLSVVTLFYYPETDPLTSRYVFHADSFERAAIHVNPDYKTFYKYIEWESRSPLHTLLARYSLILFTDNLAYAVVFLHLGAALLGAVLNYITNRYFLSVLPSFFISLFLMTGRTHLPIVRGLSHIGVLFLIPFALIFIHNLAITQDRSRREKQLIPIMLVAVSLAVMYCLGNHEVVFAMTFLFGFALLLLLEWIVKSKREKRFLHGPTLSSVWSGAWGVVLSIIILAWTCFGIHEEQLPTKFDEVLTYDAFMKKVFEDVEIEPALARKNPLAVFLTPFVEGRYMPELELTRHGKIHENTFLYPGEGFNGIIPLFILPGFLIGLGALAKNFVLLFKSNPGKEIPRRTKYFIMLHVVLLGLFLVTMILSGDPKPTRFTFFIYSIFALSAQGYEILAQRIGHFGGKWMGQSSKTVNNSKLPSFVVAGILLLFVSFATVMRLKKNYKDLQTYFHVYRNQILSYVIKPVIDKARTEHASKTVYIFHRKARHPSVGMLLGFKTVKNVRLSNLRDYKVLKMMKEQRKYKIIPPKNSVFYYWNENTMAFDVQYGEET